MPPPEVPSPLVAFLRARGSQGLLRALKPWARLCLEVIRSPHGIDAWKRVVSYILTVNEGPRAEYTEFAHHLRRLQRGDPPVPTLAEQFREEGREEGRDEGRVEGMALLLTTQLTKRFGPLAADVRARLNHAKGDDLDRWAERILTAATLDEVFEEK